MNGLKFKYPIDFKQKCLGTGFPMYTNMNDKTRVPGSLLWNQWVSFLKSVNKRFENKSRQLSPNRRMRSRSPSSSQVGHCYNCGGQGHFHIDCPITKR